MISNGRPIPLGEVPVVPLPEFRDRFLQAVRAGAHISAVFGHPADGRLTLYAVIGQAADGVLSVFATEVADGYPALTLVAPQVHWFERELWEQWSVRPEGHPWLKPIRWQKGGEPCVMDYFPVRGEEVHEVAVGPVHAGVIEPGHFRFQCHGENVFHLEVSLGYQHRGVERALAGGPGQRTLHQIETLAGDTTIGHATAYAHALEGLTETRVSARAHALRGIALELERLANHTGDLGALANDVGYLPTASYCGRLRGDWLNLTALLCGNRFGRSLVRVGGVGFDIADPMPFLDRIESAADDVEVAVNLLWDTPSVMARFEETGRLSRETAIELGLVGPAARACGVECDVRHDFPTGIFKFAHIPVAAASTGDVFARAFVRWLEIQRSITFLREQIQQLPGGEIRSTPGPMKPNHVVVSLVEGWRGEICHVAITDSQGRFAAYKVVDPSFHNWFGLAMAMRGQPISDFPLCNKSFNLSYCGHDL
ncbi:MAG: NADH-quinone oxidoreductase subunit C [Planctomycetes bacterium]|nr:NADH-quinone oxidoreductase subunit C [Planctomycetota bacterium]